MTACFDRNDLEVPEQFRKVFEFGGGSWAEEQGSFSTTAFTYYASLTCGHCDMPLCLTACPDGAISKDIDTGIVRIDQDKCIGCMSCKEVCPYSHPVLHGSGVAGKCSLCSEENEEGIPEPACAAACPVRVLEPGSIDELRAQYGNNNLIGSLDNRSEPNVVIELHRDASAGGELLNPAEVNR